MNSKTLSLQISDEPKIFSASINIQIGLSLLILLLGFSIGGYFLNNYMNIPTNRLIAANWVLYCSLFMFCINLVSIPYNACIIAHERMTAFAYVSILEALLKLLVCFLIILTPYDRLISYAILLVIVAFIIRVVYGIYCNRHFQECHYRFECNQPLLKQIGGFAGWQFLCSSCWIFNTQGVNILINLFFGVTLNAARGIATQVDGAIQQFVNNFMTAVNPQITKSYASGDREGMFLLICRGAKFSYFLLLLFAVPVLFEAEYILKLWLKNVPEYAAIFLRLTIIGTTISMLGVTGQTACMATGNIKKYSIWISSVGVLVFPLTWVAFRCGLPVESTYIIFILVYIGVNIVRLQIMKGLLKFPVMLFVREVIGKILIVTPLVMILPTILINFMHSSFVRLVLVSMLSLISTGFIVFYIGLSHREREVISLKIHDFKRKIDL